MNANDVKFCVSNKIHNKFGRRFYRILFPKKRKEKKSFVCKRVLKGITHAIAFQLSCFTIAALHKQIFSIQIKS